MNFLKALLKAIDVFVAMGGLRLDAGRMLIAWIPLIGLSSWLAYFVNQNEHHISFVAASWLFYYGGISLILGTRINHFMIRKLGEKKALALYDMICGLMFFNLGSGIGLAALHEAGSFELSSGLKWSLFALLTVVGFGIKFWATWIVGINTYYFRDLFLDRSHGEFTATGPYKFLPNPMYGIGNFHAYSAAIVTGSAFGLWYAVGCHIGIYSFYLFVEKPFIRRTYGSN
ncbi:MAG: methyltransferase [Verrucomicrobiota bacterium]|jgi:protein-S-isoprenylcysteine O-methyltransferase Ste14|nr:hypothetical protein [Verrucomicrobiales bacterium]MEC9081209.1 methyltransferase [Verrucomicrobiota bacterium]MEE2943099.1 methyltransferase [Verrucomicrobiota bacterium]|tara:strand:- start:3359 stop:4045 length:687 start_codon:yes stop_codon:yes gene_type:complete